jgi:phytoene dehydrogenase-like protein
MKSYDAIVIGGGISGLGVAALLSKKGYRTVLLEKESILGGRSTSFPYRGYTVDIGLHAIASYSSSGIERLVREVETTLELIPIKPSLMHFDLDTRTYARATSRERFGEALYNDFKRLVAAVAALDEEEIEKMHGKSAERWILDHFDNSDLVSFFDKITGFAGQPMNKVSAGAFLETLHDAFTSENSITYPARHGIKALPDALEDAIKAHGGEIITEIVVQKILFQENRVRGVQGRIVRPSFISEVEIEAPVAVLTVPLMLLPRFVPSQMIGDELLDKVSRIKAENYYYVGLVAGVKASLFERFSGQFFQWTLDRPGMDWHAIVTVPSFIDPELAPEGRHLAFIDSHGPMPHGDQAIARRRQQELLALLREVWPDFDQKTDWLHPVIYPTILPLAQPFLTGPFRPGFRVPGAAGLYLAGDATYLTGSGIGSAVKSAFACTSAIEADQG